MEEDCILTPEMKHIILLSKCIPLVINIVSAFSWFIESLTFSTWSFTFEWMQLYNIHHVCCNNSLHEIRQLLLGLLSHNIEIVT